MRRLLLLVSVLVCVDTMLYAALTPLLPHFAHEFGLSKAQAGVLVGAYAAGALVGGIPGGWATVKIGSRRAVLVGLVLDGAGEHRVRVRRQLLDAVRGAVPPGPRQRLHVGRRDELAARGRTA